MSASEKNFCISTPRIVAWAMWLIATIFFAYQYVLRLMPSIVMDDIMQQFNIDAATYGQFSGIYYLGYALMHIPLGILLDRYGPKKVMPTFIILTVIGLLPMVFAKHWHYQIAGRFVVGIGSSAAILSIFKIVRLVFKEEKFTRMLSFAVTIGLIGAIYGGAPVAYMCSIYTYKTVVLLFAGIGVALSIIAYLLMPNIQFAENSSIMTDIKDVFKAKKAILVCSMGGLMIGPLEGFADVWGKEFLQRVHGLEGTLAASLISTIFVGVCFGAPILSFIAAKTKQDHMTVFGAGMVIVASFTTLLCTGVNTSLMSFIFTILGICCTYQTIVIYKASTYVREGIVGLTTAVANMIIMLFGYAFHSMIGVIINTFGGNTSAAAFTYGIASIPIAAAIGAIGFLLLHWYENRAGQRLLA